MSDFHPRGFPKSILWITMVGDADQGFLNDAEVSWRVQQALDIDPRMVSFIFPRSFQGVPSLSAIGPADGRQFADASDLPSLFGNDTVITKRIKQLGFERPDVVLLMVSSHGDRDGQTKWGDSRVSIEQLGGVLGSLHATYQSPVVLVLDKCHAGATQSVFKYLKKQREWRDNTYVVMSSLARQYSYSETFSMSWDQRRYLWPAVANDPVFEKRVGSLFDQKQEYGRLAVNFLIGMLGAAPDAAGNGVDATDICRFAGDTEKARQQPPVNDPNRGDVFCNTDMLRNPQESAWSERFAIIAPAISVGFDGAPPPFIGADVMQSFQTLLGKFKKAFEENGDRLGLPDGRLNLHNCHAGSPCGNPWKCWIDWDPERGFCGNCVNVQRSERIPGKWSPVEKDLVASFDRIASRVIVPPWSRASALLASPPPEVKLERPAPHAVVMDASGSMIENDPDGEKRKAFWYHVLHPAIDAKKVSRLYVISFADAAKIRECFVDADPDIAKAERCFLGEIGAKKGGTSIVKALEKTVAHVPEHSVIWVLTDGMDTGKLDSCEEQYARRIWAVEPVACAKEAFFKECVVAYRCSENRTKCDQASGAEACERKRVEASKEKCGEAGKACRESEERFKDGDYSPNTPECARARTCRESVTLDYFSCLDRIRPALNKCIAAEVACESEKSRCIDDHRFAENRTKYQECLERQKNHQKWTATCAYDRSQCYQEALDRFSASLRSRQRQIFPIFLSGISGNIDALARLAQTRPSDDKMLVLPNGQTPQARQQSMESYIRNKLDQSVDSIPKGDYQCREESDDHWSCSYEIKEMPLYSTKPMIKIPFAGRTIRNAMMTVGLLRWAEGPTTEDEKQRLALVCGQQAEARHTSSNTTFRLKCDESVLNLEVNPPPAKRLRPGVWRMKVEYEYVEKAAR